MGNEIVWWKRLIYIGITILIMLILGYLIFVGLYM